jgi:hypothetical protein
MQKLEVGDAAELRIRKRDRSDNSAFGSEDVAPPAQTCVDRVFAFVRARFKSYLSTLTTLGCLFIAVGLALKLMSVQYTQHYMNNFEDASAVPVQTAPMSSLKPGGLRGGEQGGTNPTRNPRSRLARCQHTPGKLMTADSLGSLCLHTQLNASGCCDITRASAPPQQQPLPGFHADSGVMLPTQFSCELCRSDNMCCSSYEGCVSCCLSPEHEVQRQSLRQHSSLFAYSRMAEDDSFAFCAYKCRTSSASLLHENTYRSPMVHCYGMYAPSLDNRVTVNSDRSSLRPFVAAAAEREATKLVDVYFQHAARPASASKLEHEPGPG